MHLKLCMPAWKSKNKSKKRQQLCFASMKNTSTGNHCSNYHSGHAKVARSTGAIFPTLRMWYDCETSSQGFLAMDSSNMDALWRPMPRESRKLPVLLNSLMPVQIKKSLCWTNIALFQNYVLLIHQARIRGVISVGKPHRPWQGFPRWVWSNYQAKRADDHDDQPWEHPAMKTPERWRALPRRALFVSILAQKSSKDVKTSFFRTMTSHDVIQWRHVTSWCDVTWRQVSWQTGSV